ncbi:MAG: hypothetical protein LHV68_10305 [Elusimicrobia bacterium]|nr:hypothetical protein [Candidatus Liberimonas magnetica]
MTEFKAFMPHVEVNGQTVLSIVDGLTVKETGFKILAANWIKDPKPNHWYLQENWLNAFKEISKKIGPLALNAIGRKIPENADWPSEVNSIESALQSIDIAYHMNHRINGEVMFNPATGAMKEGIGHYEFKKNEEGQVLMICQNPYPCDFDKGIIYAAANKFKPAGVKQISVVEEETNTCRKKGDDTCIYIVSWY